MSERTNRILSQLEKQINELTECSILVEQHPDLNWSSYAPGRIYVSSADEMAEAAKELGGRWDKKSTDWSYELRQQREYVELVISATHDAVCVKVGEETEQFTENIPEEVRNAVLEGEVGIVVTRTKPIWKCPDSILSVTSNSDTQES